MFYNSNLSCSQTDHRKGDNKTLLLFFCDRFHHLNNLKSTIVLEITFVRQRSKLKLPELLLKPLDNNVFQQFRQVFFLNLLLVGSNLLLGLNLKSCNLRVDLCLDTWAFALQYSMSHLLLTNFGLLDVFSVHQRGEERLNLHRFCVNYISNFNCILANTFNNYLFLKPKDQKVG